MQEARNRPKIGGSGLELTTCAFAYPTIELEDWTPNLRRLKVEYPYILALGL
jgi:hypothetical protein